MIPILSFNFQNCQTCSNAQSDTLKEVTSNLGTLAELLEGRPNTPNMEDMTSDADDEDASGRKNFVFYTL